MIFRLAFPKFLCLFAAAAILLGALTPVAALAAQPMPFAAAPENPLTLDSCTQNRYQKWDLTAKIVDCLETTIKDATVYIMNGLSDFMVPIVGAMFTLAVVMFGYRIASGEREIVKRAIAFLLRMAIVGIFSYELVNGTLQFFGILDEMIVWVSNGCSPWLQIDTLIQRLFGIGQSADYMSSGAGTSSIAAGMTGLVGASLVTSSTGMFLFMAAAMAFISLIMFIFRIVHLYASAILMIAFLMLIAPMIIPLAIFNVTERYVKVWADKMFAAILTPVLLFAFLAQFLGVFNDRIDNLFSLLGSHVQIPMIGLCDRGTVLENPDLRPYWKTDQPTYAWLMPVDAALSGDVSATAQTKERSTPAVQSNITPQLQHSYNAGSTNTYGIDFGADNISITQQLIFSLIILFLYAMLMKSMIGLIPDIASNIAGTATGLDMGPTSLEHSVNRALGGGKGGLSSLKKGLSKTMQKGGSAGSTFSDIKSSIGGLFGGG